MRLPDVVSRGASAAAIPPGVGWLGVASLVLLAGCQCKPVLPDDPSEDEDTSQPDTAPPPHTGDTAPPTVAGPCTITEVEPNNAPSDAMPLPLDTYLCGEFGAPLDLDTYTIELPEDGWLGVYFDAEIRGSFADGVISLTSEENGIGAERDNDDDSRDAHVVIPAPAGTYTAVIIERNFNGDESQYFYELVASVAKDPFEGDAAEAEPNDTSETANLVSSGQRVEGLIGEPADQDWYKVLVPAGRHTVVVDVDAYGLGSPTDLSVYAYENGVDAAPLTVAFGLAGAGADPYWSYVSSGNETLWFRLEEGNNSGGSAWWYGFVLTVEAS
ncbi:MAG: hypothetical protein H0V89_08815 [Deltaproteobacteria bacterium]|nr:hypothetical protein [Deltaproteobacteria bacterium]